jgi:ADP-heptose:LPS heptosyltransferase
VLKLTGVQQVETPTFTDALSLIKTAELLIGPEGGLHHGAAAVGTRAVVFFGHFIPPQVTGYDMHINLTGGATEFCGSTWLCSQCDEALKRISADEVIAAAENILCH